MDSLDHENQHWNVDGGLDLLWRDQDLSHLYMMSLAQGRSPRVFDRSVEVENDLGEWWDISRTLIM